MAPQRDAGKAPGSAPGLHVGHGLGDEAPAHAGTHDLAPETEIAGHHQHDAGTHQPPIAEPIGKPDQEQAGDEELALVRLAVAAASCMASLATRVL